MTDVKSAVPFRGEAEVGIVRSFRGSCGIASSWDTGDRAIAHTLFAATSWRAKASLSSRFVTAACPAGCCQEQNTASGSSRPASRSFRGIIFSIPTASTVVAYNISRHINIPERRRAVHSAGQPRTNRATATSSQWHTETFSLVASLLPRVNRKGLLNK